MAQAVRTLTVALGERSYPIHIAPGLLEHSGEMIRAALGECTCAIITDDRVGPLYLARVEASLRAAGLRCASLILPEGESSKSLTQLSRVYDFLCQAGMTRRDAVLALGGGVMGDLAGLAAATFLRGVSLIQLPTSLLAQVDSSVGGKVAVDLPQGKNLVGAFHQPRMVLLDPETLETLSPQVWRDGLGEVVKYGCIGDAALFELLEQHAAGGRSALMAHMEDILLHCLRAKERVVEADEHDTGERMILNFGHTLGHAVEAVQGYGGLRHGEAVALGMAVVTRMSEARGMTAPGTSARLDRLLDALGLPTHGQGIAPQTLMAPMRLDKKSLGGALRIILLKEIGACYVETTSVDWFAPVGDYL